MAIGPYFCLSRNAGAAHLVALGQVVVRHAGAPWTVHSASVLHLLAKPLDLAREGSLLLAKLHALLMHPVAQSAERLALAPQRRRGRWSRPKPPGAIHEDGLRRAADRLAVDALQEGGGLLAGGADAVCPIDGVAHGLSIFVSGRFPSVEGPAKEVDSDENQTHCHRCHREADLGAGDEEQDEDAEDDPEQHLRGMKVRPDLADLVGRRRFRAARRLHQRPDVLLLRLLKGDALAIDHDGCSADRSKMGSCLVARIAHHHLFDLPRGKPPPGGGEVEIAVSEDDQPKAKFFFLDAEESEVHQPTFHLLMEDLGLAGHSVLDPLTPEEVRVFLPDLRHELLVLERHRPFPNPCTSPLYALRNLVSGRSRSGE